MKLYFLRTSTGLALSLFLSFNAAMAQTCTGSTPLSSASGANNNVIGSLAWSGLGNTVSLDGSYATAAPLLALLATIPTQYLQITGFSFVIPSTYTMCGITATMCGITATISKGQTSLLTIGTVTDNSVVLVKNGVPVTGIGANHALTGNWNYGSIATSNYGSATDGWGTTWLNSDISSNPNFGIAISANINDVLGVIPVAAIDQVTMTIYSAPPTTLAIDLVSFTAQGASSGNVLNWTANTTGVAGSFIIQRSANGTDWQDMTNISAEIGQDSYSYTDATPLTGQNFYRIQVLNTDRSTEGYSIVAIVATKNLTTVRTWPNPFTDMINITSPNNFSRVILRDALGRTLQVKEYGSGVNNAQLNAASLPPGLYFVQVDAAIYKLIKN